MSNYMITGIGKRIKAIRLEKRVKLTELAEIAGVSKGLLSKVENGRTVPSLPVLLSLIESLEMKPSDFFQNMDFSPPRKYIHKKANAFEQTSKEEDAYGFDYKLILEKGFEAFSFEAVTLEVHPGAQRKKVTTDAYEFKYVLEGNIRYQIDDEFIELEKGDILFYDGRQPHVPHNDTDQTGKMLVIYLFDGDKPREEM